MAKSASAYGFGLAHMGWVDLKRIRLIGNSYGNEGWTN